MTDFWRIAAIKRKLRILWLALRRRATQERRLTSAAQPKLLVARPSGPLIWLHLPRDEELATFGELITDLLDGRPDLHLLLSFGGFDPDAAGLENLPARVFWQPMPLGSAPHIGRFLDHWRPDLMIWSGGDLRRIILAAVSQAKIPMLMINTRPAAFGFWHAHWLGGHVGKVLARFDRIMLEDEAEAARLLRFGVPKHKIEVIGSLQGSIGALKVDETQLPPLLGRFKGKQVWLVVGLRADELETITEAHLLARRSAPGLILILVVPRAPLNVEVTAALRNDGWAVASRDAGEMPGPRTEIYVVTGWTELGLWYRLASICYIGGTIEGGDARNPFEAAHFGCAILHGSRTGQYADSFARLSRANAAVLVPNAETLGPALVECLPAGRVAELATNAWSVSSENADVAARLLGIIDGYLDRSA